MYKILLVVNLVKRDLHERNICNLYRWQIWWKRKACTTLQCTVQHELSSLMLSIMLTLKTKYLLVKIFSQNDYTVIGALILWILLWTLYNKSRTHDWEVCCPNFMSLSQRTSSTHCHCHIELPQLRGLCKSTALWVEEVLYSITLYICGYCLNNIKCYDLNFQ